MNILSLIPYEIIEGKDFLNEKRIIINSVDFEGIEFIEGRITFSFINSNFKKLYIENNDNIVFKDIIIQFMDCYIEEIRVENINTSNISILFDNSIINGSINNPMIRYVRINNCLLINSFFLSNLNHISVIYDEKNIFIRKWKKLLLKNLIDFESMIKMKNTYYIDNCKEVFFIMTENKKPGKKVQLDPYSMSKEKRLRYYLTDEEKKKFNINVFLRHSGEIDHKSTIIKNAKLLDLSLVGHYKGEVLIENSRIDNFYIRGFSAQLGAVFYGIKPFRIDKNDTKLEINASNLDKQTFDNFSFDDYKSISLYRNKFGQTTSFISCNFPNTYKEFEKIIIVENIHNYSEVRDDNYYISRYETFLQLKKVVENSGNFYEAQKFQMVSNEALRMVGRIPFWDKLILRINKISNNHGLSISFPFIWIIITSITFYILYLWSLKRVFNSNDIDLDLFGYYFSFVDITHRTNFLVTKPELNGWSLFIDYINKIVLSFFIYQFIAAFRKYGKK